MSNIIKPLSDDQILELSIQNEEFMHYFEYEEKIIISQLLRDIVDDTPYITNDVIKETDKSKKCQILKEYYNNFTNAIRETKILNKKDKATYEKLEQWSNQMAKVFNTMLNELKNNHY